MQGDLNRVWTKVRIKGIWNDLVKCYGLYFDYQMKSFIAVSVQLFNFLPLQKLKIYNEKTNPKVWFSFQK